MIQFFKELMVKEDQYLIDSKKLWEDISHIAVIGVKNKYGRYLYTGGQWFVEGREIDLPPASGVAHIMASKEVIYHGDWERFMITREVKPSHFTGLIRR